MIELVELDTEWLDGYVFKHDSKQVELYTQGKQFRINVYNNFGSHMSYSYNQIKPYISILKREQIIRGCLLENKVALLIRYYGLIKEE